MSTKIVLRDEDNARTKIQTDGATFQMTTKTVREPNGVKDLESLGERERWGDRAPERARVADRERTSSGREKRKSEDTAI